MQSQLSLSDLKKKSESQKTKKQQECIPVGCVPPAAVAVCSGGGVSASVYAGIHHLGPGHPSRAWAWTPSPPSPTSPLGLGLDTPLPRLPEPQPPNWVWE